MQKRMLVLLFLAACHRHPVVNLAIESKEILQLEENQKTYHYTGQADAFVALFSDHFLHVAGGNVDSPTRGASLRRFRQYFAQVRVIAWDNLQEPVIRFSDDGSIAYVAVQKQVVTVSRAADRKQQPDTTVFAWLAIYKKNKGSWKIDCVSSTNH